MSLWHGGLRSAALAEVGRGRAEAKLWVAPGGRCCDDSVPTQAALELVPSDAFRIIFGELVFASGLVACIIYLLRARKTDPSALYFGLAAVFYGLRLIVELDFLHHVFPVFPWDILDSGITLVVGIPFVLFFGSTIARAYPWVIRGFIAVQVALAAGGILAFFFHGPLRYVWLVKRIIGITSVIVFAWISFFPKVEVDREVRVL